MHIEKGIDRDALGRLLGLEYGLQAAKLAYLPVGAVGHSYAVDAADGKFLAKVYGDSRASYASIARLDFTLPLTLELDQKGIVPVAAPVPTTSGALSASLSGSPVILYPFIEGRNPEPAEMRTPAIVSQMGAIVGRMHRMTDLIATTVPADEFGVPFETDLRDGVRALQTIGPADSWGKRELRRMLLPLREGIDRRLGRLHELGAWAQAARPKMVLCHTDLHYLNVIVDPEGRIHVLDWEGALTAPREHDLFSFTGDGAFEGFLKAYAGEHGPVHLEPDLFSFYFHRRNLEDLTDWVVRILHENTTDEEDRLDLAGIEEDCLTWWDDLDAGAALRGMIARYSTAER